MTMIRRLRILETAFGPPLAPRPSKPLDMSVLSVEDLRRLVELTECLKQTGDYHAFSDADLEDAERILMAAGAESTRPKTHA